MRRFKRKGKVFSFSKGKFWNLGRGLRIEDLTEHVAVLGSTGSGKTSTVLATLVRACGRAGAPIIVFGAKRSDAEDFSRYLEEAGAPPPVVIRAAEDGAPPPYVFPIFRYLQELGACSTEIASVITETLQVVGGDVSGASASERFWQDNMRKLLACTFEVLRATPWPMNRRILAKFLRGIPMLDVPPTDDRGFFEAVIESASRHADDAVHEAIDYLTREFPSMDARPASSIMATWKGLATDLDLPPLNTVLADPQEGQTVVTPSTLLDEGRSIIIDIPTLSRPRPGKAFQTLFHGALRLAMHRRTERQRRICVAFFDEFQESVPSASVLQPVLATARSQDMGYVLATQSIRGCQAKFGSVQADALFGLPGTLISCRNGDPHTKRFLSEAAGRVIIAGSKDKEGEPRTRRRVTPEDVAGLSSPSKRQWRPRADAIVIRDNEVHRIRFDRNPPSMRRWLGGCLDYLFDIERHGVWGVLKHVTAVIALASLLGLASVWGVREGYRATPSVAELRTYARSLWVGSAHAKPPASRFQVVHLVQPGETLAGIAEVYRVRVAGSCSGFV